MTCRRTTQRRAPRFSIKCANRWAHTTCHANSLLHVAFTNECVTWCGVLGVRCVAQPSRHVMQLLNQSPSSTITKPSTFWPSFSCSQVSLSERWCWDAQWIIDSSYLKGISPANRSSVSIAYDAVNWFLYSMWKCGRMWFRSGLILTFMGPLLSNNILIASTCPLWFESW